MSEVYTLEIAFLQFRSIMIVDMKAERKNLNFAEENKMSKAYEFLKEFHEKYVIKKGDTVVVVMTGSGFYIAGRAVAG